MIIALDGEPGGLTKGRPHPPGCAARVAGAFGTQLGEQDRLIDRCFGLRPDGGEDLNTKFAIFFLDVDDDDFGRWWLAGERLRYPIEQP